jgi:hypothetical protein
MKLRQSWKERWRLKRGPGAKADIRTRVAVLTGAGAIGGISGGGAHLHLSWIGWIVAYVVVGLGAFCLAIILLAMSWTMGEWRYHRLMIQRGASSVDHGAT